MRGVIPPPRAGRIVQALGGDPAERQAALEHFARSYWPAIYSFARLKGHAPQDAEDLTQSFLLSLIERESFEGLSAAKGRFRSWLLAALSNFLRKDWRDRRRLKRGGGAPQLSIDHDLGEAWLESSASDEASPDLIFDRRWAAGFLERCLNQLASSYEREGRTEVAKAIAPIIAGIDARKTLRGSRRRAWHERRHGPRGRFPHAKAFTHPHPRGNRGHRGIARPGRGGTGAPLRPFLSREANASRRTGLLPMKTSSAEAMISKTSQCATCGREVPPTSSLLGDFCPACILGAGRTPGSAFAASRDTTTWAELFPQLEVDATLLAEDGLSIYRGRVVDSDPPESALLQVLSGEAFEAAGGSALLEARLHHLVSQSIDDVAAALDFGDLGDDFFLITTAPELPSLAESEEAHLSSVAAVMEHSRKTLQAAWSEGIAVIMDPKAVFHDSATGRTIWTPALQPDPSITGDLACEDGPAEAIPGQTIGAYTLVERAGEGGFGEVWQAKQARPVERTVALKILKAGLHSKRARNRFEVEQQALAQLEHPHIARFFDGGITPDGRPYFAMEWIEGQALNRHCRVPATPLAERLRLFRQVCEAVHHAHQKGIIHRDLKPSNVMVTATGGEATAKVIDFGIARALEETGPHPAHPRRGDPRHAGLDESPNRPPGRTPPRSTPAPTSTGWESFSTNSSPASSPLIQSFLPTSCAVASGRTTPTVLPPRCPGGNKCAHSAATSTGSRCAASRRIRSGAFLQPPPC